MKTVNQVSKLMGVSVRTLHHYDAIGLLKPSKVTGAGYRLYDDTALQRLQRILLFRELQFPLKEIKAILDSPGFDPAEVKERWGATPAYREFTQKTAGQTGLQREETNRRLMELFAGLGSLRHLPPADPAVQEQIAALQQFITGHYYTCTDKIFLGLGQMYENDPRMRDNIDRAGGEGTAAFVRQAISVCCAR